MRWQASRAKEGMSAGFANRLEHTLPSARPRANRLPIAAWLGFFTVHEFTSHTSAVSRFSSATSLQTQSFASP